MVARRMLRGFVITALVAFALGSLVALIMRQGPAEPDAGARGDEQGRESEVAAARPAEADRVNPLVAELTAAGWTEDAARAVAELNQEWFTIQLEEHPARYLRQTARLRGLGAHTDLMPFIARRPETAGLLVKLEEPGVAVEVLHAAGADYPRIATFFIQHIDPSDAQALAWGLQDNWEVVSTLQQRGLLNPEVLFIFDRETEGAREYELWLRETLERRMRRSDVELASFVNLVMRHGPAIRARMASKPDFRDRFRSEHWPALLRACGPEEGKLELFVEEPRVWDLLAAPNGETLLRTCGRSAVDLLYGNPQYGFLGYPESLHARVRELLLYNDQQIALALHEFRDERLFHELLRRSLPTETFRRVLGNLLTMSKSEPSKLEASPNAPSFLLKYANLSNSALADEVGPPPSGPLTWVPFYYTLYEVPKQVIQGRDVSGMDWFLAIADPAFLVIDLSSGGGTRAARQVVAKGGWEAFEQTARGTGQSAFQTALRQNTGKELARRAVGPQLVESLTERQLASWSVTGTLAEMGRAVRGAMGRATTFEITKPVQFAFQYSGVGRESFKRITGLEARLFMRGDARVYVRLSNLADEIVGNSTVMFFSGETALACASESQPGRAIVKSAQDAVLATQEQFPEWNQQVSAWWLLNASVHSSELSQE